MLPTGRCLQNHMSRRKRPHPWQSVVIAAGLAVASLIAVQTIIVLLLHRATSVQARKDAAANAKLKQ
mgnify:CR=1 FL=1